MAPILRTGGSENPGIIKKFKTNDKSVRFHKDDKNLMQMIYQIISAYFKDDCADELTLDPVLNAVLEKDGLASQPTLSRFFTTGCGSICLPITYSIGSDGWYFLQICESSRLIPSG